MSPFRWALLATLAGLVVTLPIALTELALRLADHPPSIAYGWPDAPADDEPSNQLGLRGLRFDYDAADFVVLLLGDSQAGHWGESKDPAVLPEALLQAALNTLPSGAACLAQRSRRTFKVYTLAASGWGQDQQLLALRRYLARFRADWVMLWQTPENDLWNNAFPTHYPRNGTPKPTFVLDADGQLALAERTDIIPGWLEWKLGLLAERVFRRLNRWQSSVVLPTWDPDGRWDALVLPRNDIERASPVADERADLKRFNPFVHDDPTALAKSHFVLGMNDGSARIDWMVALTRRLLAEVHATARRAGAGFLAFAYDASATAQPLYPPDGEYVLGTARIRFSAAAAERRLAAINAGLPHLRLALSYPRWRWRDDDPHLSETAARALLREVAAHLLEQCARASPL